MRYLELEDLIIGHSYVCLPYSGEKHMNLTYIGNGTFKRNKKKYSVYGDIRYVMNKEMFSSQKLENPRLENK